MERGSGVEEGKGKWWGVEVRRSSVQLPCMHDCLVRDSAPVKVK